MANNIGDRIVSLRKELNMSQESLAERLNVSRQAVSKWERGEASPDITKVAALAETFGISIDALIYGEESELKSHKPKIIALELKKKAEKLIMIAIALLIMSFAGYFALTFNDNIKLLILGIIVSAGILILIKSGFMLERFYMYNRDLHYQKEYKGRSQSEKRKDAVIVATSVLCTAVYLYVSFIHVLWHPGWLVFLLVPAVYLLFDAFEKS